MSLGPRPELMRIQERHEVQDALGGKSKSDRWTDFCTVWVRVKPLRSSEYMQADKVQGQQTHQIIMRHRDDIHGAMRGLVGLRVYQFTGTPRNMDEKRKYLMVDAAQE